MDTLAFAHLNHMVLAPGVHERFLIRFSEIRLPEQTSGDLRCNVYAGPATSAKVQSSRKEVEVQNEAGQTTLDIGLLKTPEPWVVRIKLFGRNATNLFRQSCLAEAVVLAPCPAQTVALKIQDVRGEIVNVGSLRVEIHRLLPEKTAKLLTLELCTKLKGSVLASCEPGSLTQFLKHGATDLVYVCGNRIAGSDAGTQLLEALASLGCESEVESLLHAGARASPSAVRAADIAQFPALAHRILCRIDLLPNKHEDSKHLDIDPRGREISRSSQELLWCLHQNLPCLADWVHSRNPQVIDSLVNRAGAMSKLAYEAKAWGVLHDLMNKGEELPVPALQILESALAAGHVPLARSCLPRFENFLEIESALGTCLINGREQHLVRDTLEAHWKLRTTVSDSSLYEGPAMLALQLASEDDLVECPVCFEPLCKAGPAVLLSESSCRACPHFICQDCAQKVQNEVDNRSIVQDRDTLCPLCRTTFTACARLPDPTVDPSAFFRLACLQEDGESAKLSGRAAFETLCAILPVNISSFKASFEDVLWPAWTCTNDGDEKLSEVDFLAPRGMLAWLSDHMLELKVDRELGPPPILASDACVWFHHFDYDGNGFLAKSELLRGVAKTLALAAKTSAADCATSPRMTPQKLIESIWDESRWPDGVPLEDFISLGQLSQKILSEVPFQEHSTPTSPSRQRRNVSVQEALAKARTVDLQESESYKTRLSPAMIPQVFEEIDLSGALEQLQSMLQFVEGHQHQLSNGADDASIPPVDEDFPCEQPYASPPDSPCRERRGGVLDLGDALEEMRIMLQFAESRQQQLSQSLVEDDLPSEQPSVSHPRSSLVRNFKTLQAFILIKEQQFHFGDQLLIDLDSEFIEAQPKASYVPKSCVFMNKRRALVNSDIDEKNELVLINLDGVDIRPWVDADGQETMLVTI